MTQEAKDGLAAARDYASPFSALRAAHLAFSDRYGGCGPKCPVCFPIPDPPVMRTVGWRLGEQGFEWFDEEVPLPPPGTLGDFDACLRCGTGPGELHGLPCTDLWASPGLEPGKNLRVHPRRPQDREVASQTERVYNHLIATVPEIKHFFAVEMPDEAARARDDAFRRYVQGCRLPGTIGDLGPPPEVPDLHRQVVAHLEEAIPELKGRIGIGESRPAVPNSAANEAACLARGAAWPADRASQLWRTTTPAHGEFTDAFGTNTSTAPCKFCGTGPGEPHRDLSATNSEQIAATFDEGWRLHFMQRELAPDAPDATQTPPLPPTRPDPAEPIPTPSPPSDSAPQRQPAAFLAQMDEFTYVGKTEFGLDLLVESYWEPVDGIGRDAVFIQGSGVVLAVLTPAEAIELGRVLIELGAGA